MKATVGRNDLLGVTVPAMVRWQELEVAGHVKPAFRKLHQDEDEGLTPESM